MTLAEFKEAARIYPRRSADVCWPIVAGCLCGLLWLPFYERAKEWLEHRFDPTTGDWIAVMPMMVPMTIGFGLLIPLARRAERKFAVQCQHCGKSLTSFPKIVIASKHCPSCGERVIEEAA